MFIHLDSFTTFGCDLDWMDLYCPENQTISLTSAYYGQYYYDCSSSCCAPHPWDDCSELMQQYAPVDWLYLQVGRAGYFDKEKRVFYNIVSGTQLLLGRKQDNFH